MTGKAKSFEALQFEQPDPMQYYVTAEQHAAVVCELVRVKHELRCAREEIRQLKQKPKE